MSANSDRAYTVARWAVLAAYAAAVGWIAFRAGSPTELWWWALEIPFFLWAVAPIAVPLFLPLRNWLLTGGITLMAAWSVYTYERGMFGPDTNSTSGLIFIFLPIYQWVGTAVLIVIASRMRTRKLQ